MTPIAEPLLSVAALWAVAVVTPGPNFFVVVRMAMARSRSAGLRAVAGIGLGTATWGFAGFFGVHALFAAAPWAYVLLKLLGGAYLLFLGTRLLWQGRGAVAGGHGSVEPPRSGRSAFRSGLATNLANPKSALFVASVFTTAMPGDPPVALGLMAVALMVSLSLSWYALVTVLASGPRVSDAYGRGRRWIDRAAGAVFVVFGARLIIAR